MGKNNQISGEVGELGKMSGLCGQDLKRRPVSFAEFLLNRDSVLREREADAGDVRTGDSVGEVRSNFIINRNPRRAAAGAMSR